jgi:pimeloyl-ACP methyl ester carboxylesterase
VLVGHSLGGGTLLRLALDHPEMARALVLVAPISRPASTSDSGRSTRSPIPATTTCCSRACAFFRPPTDGDFALIMAAVREP